MTTTKSTQTGLLAALAAVQAETPTLPKDKINPHYKSKFTGLDTIAETLRPILAKHGLVWITKPGQDDRGLTLLYKLVHVGTGEVEVGTMPLLLGKEDMQGFGSALTYARRYAICAVLNLVADDDDDGNTASQPASRPGRTAAGVTPTAKQLGYLKGLIHEKKPSIPALNFMLIEVGAKDITVQKNWTERLTPEIASALIDWLEHRPLPDAEHPSDVPGAAEGEFVEPEPAPDADPVPFQETLG